jgi:DNA polymerase-4
LISVADVLRHDLGTLRQWLSEREATWLWTRVHGVDEAAVVARGANKGISRDETFNTDLHADRDIERELFGLVSRAASDLRADGLTAQTVTVRLRDWDFRTRTAQRTLPDPVVADRAIMRIARDLLTELRAFRLVPARLVGVRLSSLAPERAADQLSLFAATSHRSGETHRDRMLTRAIDGVRRKFGETSILPARLTGDER